MKGTIIALNANGTKTEYEATDSDILTTLQNIVGGYIEVVPFFIKYGEQSCIAFCNEEGKLLNLPVNFEATYLWTQNQKKNGVKLDDVLMGNVAVVIGDKEFMENV